MNVINVFINSFTEILNLVPPDSAVNRINLTFCFSYNNEFVSQVLRRVLPVDNIQIIHSDGKTFNKKSSGINHRNVVVNFNSLELDIKSNLTQMMENIVDLFQVSKEPKTNFYILLQGYRFQTPSSFFSDSLRSKFRFNLFDFTDLDFSILKKAFSEEWESQINQYDNRKDFRVRYQAERIIKILDFIDYDLIEFDQLLGFLSLRTKLLTRCSQLDTRDMILTALTKYIHSKETLFWDIYDSLNNDQRTLLKDIYLAPGKKTHNYFKNLTHKSENTNRQNIYYLNRLGVIKQKNMEFIPKSNLYRVIILSRNYNKKIINLIEDFISFGDATYRSSQKGKILEEDYFLKHKQLRSIYFAILRIKSQNLETDEMANSMRYSFSQLKLEMNNYWKRSSRLTKNQITDIDNLLTENRKLLSDMFCYQLYYNEVSLSI